MLCKFVLDTTDENTDRSHCANVTSVDIAYSIQFFSSGVKTPKEMDGVLSFFRDTTVSYCSVGSPCPVLVDALREIGVQRPRTTMDDEVFVQ